MVFFDERFPTMANSVRKRAARRQANATGY
jgi:hypothetical protein